MFCKIYRRTASVALYSVVWLAIWARPAIPAALAYQPLTTATTPLRVEAVAVEQEQALPSMQANQMAKKEDTDTMKEHIKTLQLKVQGMTVGCRFLYIFGMAYMLLGPYLSDSAKFLFISGFISLLLQSLLAHG
jgi:hypothetical protein